MLHKISEKLFPLGFKKDFMIFLKNAVPLILSGISQMLLTLTSIFFCGHLGGVELAACSLAAVTINISVFVPCFGFSMACDTLFPQIYGGENKKNIGLYLQKGLLLSIGVCFFSSSLLMNTKHILKFVISDPEVYRLTDLYLITFIPSIFIFNVATLLIKYIQSQNIILPVTLMNYIVIAINAILHWVFIYGLNFGISGAPIAINISTLLLLILLMGYIYWKKIYVDTWPGWCTESLYEWKLYLKLAIPSLMLIFIEWSSFEIATLASGTLGTLQLDIMSISQQIIYIFFQFPLGLAIAGNIHVGQLLGANKPKEAKNAARVLFLISICMVFFFATVMVFTADYLIYMFSTDPVIIDGSKNVVRFCAIIHMLDGTQGTCSGILRSLGEQGIVSVFLFISFYIVGLPLGVGLLLNTSMELYGYFIGMGCGLLLLLTMQISYLFIKVDWDKVAHEAHELSKKSINKPDKMSLENESDTKKEIIITDVEKICEKSSGETRSSLKIQILKRLGVLIIFLTVFVASCIGHYGVESSFETMINNSSNSTE